MDNNFNKNNGAEPGDEVFEGWKKIRHYQSMLQLKIIGFLFLLGIIALVVLYFLYPVEFMQSVNHLIENIKNNNNK